MKLVAESLKFPVRFDAYRPMPGDLVRGERMAQVSVRPR